MLYRTIPTMFSLNSASNFLAASLFVFHLCLKINTCQMSNMCKLYKLHYVRKSIRQKCTCKASMHWKWSIHQTHYLATKSQSIHEWHHKMIFVGHQYWVMLNFLALVFLHFLLESFCHPFHQTADLRVKCMTHAWFHNTSNLLKNWLLHLWSWYSNHL